MRIYKEAMNLENHNQYQEYSQKHENYQEIRKRYQKLILILQNAEKVKQDQDKMNFHHLYEKDLHKKLRKKLYEKKKRKKNSLDNNPDLQEFQKDEGRSCPNSPGSQYMTSSSIFNEKYSIKRLSKKKQTSRFQSQILRPAELHISNKASSRTQAQKYDDVKRNTKKSFDFKYQIYDTTLGKRQLMNSSNLKMNQLSQFDPGDSKIHPNQIEYLPVAMRDFKKVHQKYAQHANDKNWQVPKIKIEMPLDGKEIKPQKIDDW